MCARKPFGEPLVVVHTARYENSFKFSGKELDDITGLYDHGARSRNPISTLWYGIDPLFEKYPDFSPYNYCAGNPVKLVDLDGRKPTPYEAALIAQHVYGNGGKLSGGWQQYSDILTYESGIKYAVYTRLDQHNNPEFVLAFAGTDDMQDVSVDLNMALGCNNISQYGQAISLSEQVNNNFEGYELTLVGHSLGGGLAAAGSMATDIPAITFNPAAMCDANKEKLGIMDGNTSQIRNYVIKDEIVTSCQKAIGLVADGRTVTLPKRERGWLDSIFESVKNHKISEVVKALEP